MNKQSHKDVNQRILVSDKCMGMAITLMLCLIATTVLWFLPMMEQHYIIYIDKNGQRMLLQ